MKTIYTTLASVLLLSSANAKDCQFKRQYTSHRIGSASVSTNKMNGYLPFDLAFEVYDDDKDDKSEDATCKADMALMTQS